MSAARGRKPKLCHECGQVVPLRCQEMSPGESHGKWEAPDPKQCALEFGHIGSCATASVPGLGRFYWTAGRSAGMWGDVLVGYAKEAK